MRPVVFFVQSNSFKREAFIYGAKDFPMSSFCASSPVPSMPVAKKKKREKRKRGEHVARHARQFGSKDQSGDKRREKISNQDSDAIYPYRSVDRVVLRDRH